MTTFRLNAGRPPGTIRAAFRASSAKPAVDIDDFDYTVDPYYAPYPSSGAYDLPLRCGCTIPWPVVHVLSEKGRQVECDLHGFQRVTQEIIRTAKREQRKEAKQCPPNQTSLELDAPPF